MTGVALRGAGAHAGGGRGGRVHTPVAGRAGKDVRAGDQRVAGRPRLRAGRRNRPPGRWRAVTSRVERGRLRGYGGRDSVTRSHRQARELVRRTSASFPGYGGPSPCCWRGPRWSRAPHLSPSCPPPRWPWLLLTAPSLGCCLPQRGGSGDLPPPPPAAAWAERPLHPAFLPTKREGKSCMLPSGPLEVRQGHLRSG